MSLFKSIIQAWIICTSKV